MAFANIVSMGKSFIVYVVQMIHCFVSQKLSFCSWILAGPSLLLCWHLIAIALQASTLPFWVILPLSHHSLPHLCVPGYGLSLSGRALMSMSIRVWHCVIQTCIWWMWIKFERIRSSGKSCFFCCCPTIINWICRTGTRSLLRFLVYWSLLMSFDLVIPAETWLRGTFLEPLIHLEELFSTTTVRRPRWALQYVREWTVCVGFSWILKEQFAQSISTQLHADEIVRWSLVIHETSLQLHNSSWSRWVLVLWRRT